jgi:hypothetical protein
MLFKQEYLSGNARFDKETFRDYQGQAEKAFEGQCQGVASRWSSAMLDNGYSVVWRQRREANVLALLTDLEPSTAYQPLFREWPMGHCPFNAVLLFNSEAQRDRVRAVLQEARIYAPIHWHLTTANSQAMSLSRRILTIPCDQRYTSADMKRVAGTINAAVQAN